MKMKTMKLTKREKALLSIIIHEVLGLNPNKKIRELLQSWVSTNDLHPEDVETGRLKKVEK